MNLSPDSYCTYLISIAHKLVRLLPDRDLLAAFLFGSAAWGDADAVSDLGIRHNRDLEIAVRTFKLHLTIKMSIRNTLEPLS